MSGAPETRYTDRDVRENGELIELAEEYVDAYNGDFQYLIDMKMRVHSGLQLTTPMVKGILNCMRADPRIQNLPAPLPPEENVLELRPRKKKRKPYVGTQDCVLAAEPVEHNAHSWETDMESGFCMGWHKINRTEEVRTDAIIKVPFIMGRGGKMIHLVDTESKLSNFDWSPRAHSWGFAYTEYGALHWPVLLHVKTACKYPSYLKNPLLLTKDVASAMVFGPGPLENESVPYCQHCTEVMRDFT